MTEMKQLAKRVKELENENLLLGERCNQLLKDKGNLTDQIADIKANCDLAIEGRDIKIKELELELTVEKDLHAEEVELHLHAEEYIKELEKENEEMKKGLGCETCQIHLEYMRLNDKIRELEQQIEKMKCCENCKHKKNEVDRCELLMYTMNACLCKNFDKWEIKEND